MGRRSQKTPQQKFLKRLNTRICQGLGLALMVFLWWMMGGSDGALPGLQWVQSSIHSDYSESEGLKQSPVSVSDGNISRCVVREVIDGDTFTCDLNEDGRISRPEEYVRLLGIDAPETHFSKKIKPVVMSPFPLKRRPN